jgi:hypothetical protein
MSRHRSCLYSALQILAANGIGSKKISLPISWPPMEHARSSHVQLFALDFTMLVRGNKETRSVVRTEGE